MAYICQKCAEKHGGKMPDGHLATFHRSACTICGTVADVTEPRDYGLVVVVGECGGAYVRRRQPLTLPDLMAKAEDPS